MEPLAGFHVVQSSVLLLTADGVPIIFQRQYAHICAWHTVQIHLFSEVKMSLVSQVLSTSESFFLKHIFFPFPYFLCPYVWAKQHFLCLGWSQESIPAGKISWNHLYLLLRAAHELTFRARANCSGDLRVQSSALNFACHLVLDHTSHVLLERWFLYSHRRGITPYQSCT